jgi:hypothetical protein
MGPRWYLDRARLRARANPGVLALAWIVVAGGGSFVIGYVAGGWGLVAIVAVCLVLAVAVLRRYR